jgi:hypothetical protein
MWFPGSSIGEFDFGPFNGHAKREEPKAARWDGYRQEMRPASKAHFSVHVTGINGAWREVLIPLARGRTLEKAVQIACGQFAAPSDITPDSHGWYGATIDLR